MLSVGGSGGRSRSKSPGRRDERSRSRDIRAPSPARRAPLPDVGPPSSRSRKYYDDEDNDDEDLLSDDDDDVNDDDRRRHNHSRAIEKARPGEYERPNAHRSRYVDEEVEEDRASSRFADSRRREYQKQDDAYSRGSRREESPRAQDYTVPGQFDDDDDQGYDRKDKVRYASGQARTNSTGTAVKSGYGDFPQFQYAQIDQSQLRYLNKGGLQYTRTPSESGPAYTRNPHASVTVEQNRHRQDDSYDSRGERYQSNLRRDYDDSRREHDRAKARVEERNRKEEQRYEKEREARARLAKEHEELDLIEEKRRELDRLKRERAEVEEELWQKKSGKSVTIRDDRDYKKDDPGRSKRADRYEDDRRRRYYDDDSESEKSEDERRQKPHYNRFNEHEDNRYNEQYDPRRDDKRRDRSDSKLDKYEDTRQRGSDSKRPKAQVVEIHPSGHGGMLATASPGLSTRTRQMSVSGQTPSALTLALPGTGHSRRGSVSAAPASPLLESYKGTYQTISPMPSPMALAHHPDDSDLSDLDLEVPGRLKHRDSDDSEEDSDVSRSERRPKSILKRHRELGVSYDPEDDATALAAEMKRSSPSPELLIKILPTLRNDSIVSLRTEYKKYAKIQGKGINIAKHIKMKLGSTNVGKAAYATALGRWESEAHWANFWYQSGSSRRELLIEALFGRSNAEIRAIKEAFSDKRYGDSLVKCMEAELKKDKFRLAVLKVLEAKRGDEVDQIDGKLVYKDVSDLHRAVASKDGGETAMINIIVVRSNEHLRHVLREYEERYEENFARSMIKKSQNLVGETLAHILNGVLNRPVRDALLLHQAIAETSKDRAELIVSRLVRFHWEPKHLERIKDEYRKRYKVSLEEDIRNGTKGDFSAFCIALCRGAVR